MVGIDSTRETTDKVRGAIFNLINSYQMQGVCLDLFSGSGAMGLEALSRGADFCFFNDKSTAISYYIVNDDYNGYVSDHYGVWFKFVIN